MKTDKMKNAILGCLYGQAIGDAMGMPSELWRKKQVEDYFGWIDRFLPPPPENLAANLFKQGEFTDDTQLAIAMMDSLIEHNGKVNTKSIGLHILKWAKEVDAFNKNILGPTTKKALLALNEGIDINPSEKNGVTNGAAMRIAPLGCLLRPDNYAIFYKNIREASCATHESDIAIAGALCIALAISLAINQVNWQEIKPRLIDWSNRAQQENSTTFTPLLGERIRLILQDIAMTPNLSDQERLSRLYSVWGAGMDTLESVSMAIALVEVANTDPARCAVLGANLGGDTDTIGAMATAICGAIQGVQAFPSDWIETIKQVNHIDFSDYAVQLLNFRQKGAYYE